VQTTFCRKVSASSSCYGCDSLLFDGPAALGADATTGTGLRPHTGTTGRQCFPGCPESRLSCDTPAPTPASAARGYCPARPATAGQRLAMAADDAAMAPQQAPRGGTQSPGYVQLRRRWTLGDEVHPTICRPASHTVGTPLPLRY